MRLRKEQGISEEERSVLENLCALIRHDVENPRAAVQMFLDVMEEIADQPSEQKKWKESLRFAFQKVTQRMEEVAILTWTVLSDVQSFRLEDVVQSANAQAGCEFVKWNHDLDVVVQGNPSLLQFFFLKLAEASGSSPHAGQFVINEIYR